MNLYNKRFEIKFHPDAAKEYQSLDNSVIGIVNNAIDDLELRADEVGTPLRNNQSTKLAGCKEKKLRTAGIRIVFRVTDEKVDILRIVYILTIEKRSRDFVFKVAHKRNITAKKIPKQKLSKYLESCKSWNDFNKK